MPETRIGLPGGDGGSERSRREERFSVTVDGPLLDVNKSTVNYVRKYRHQTVVADRGEHQAKNIFRAGRSELYRLGFYHL